MISHRGRVTNIHSQETVVFYPTYGERSLDGQSWRVHVAGAVFEPGEVTLRLRIMLRLLQRVMNVSADHLDTEIFRQRIDGFTAAMGRGRRIAVQVGSRVHVLPKKTKRNGHFRGVLRISESQMGDLRQAGHVRDGWLDFQCVTPSDDERRFAGRAQLIDPAGTSVVSDIDDTIKHTGVTCRRSLLENTFLRGFESIDGMAHQYRQWHGQGATFHYVSSSPWQLFRPLMTLCQEDEFPDGTMHLRAFRIRDHMLRRVLLIRRPGKGVVIKRMLQTFPERRFYLIGDSGEQDPELYANLARKFPQQVAGIYIRQVQQKPMRTIRCQKVFRRISPRVWRLFDNADQLPGQLGADQSSRITPCVAGLNP